ncbi:MAG: (E)-4-hydroxy-3-methylbut-2-enyl-diphosphate synthase, partial [Oscillospiraceae bacterium]|nr:(E)-4-hydroxy-3-methylbut-2-enyl-diphosphate synthase [Oscillospiraceae bacterium]
MFLAKEVKIGKIAIGGENPVAIQSMISVPSTDIEGSVKQAVELEKAGCEILRAAIPDMAAIELIPAIKEKIDIPLVADIHFDYRLALAAVENGIDKIRINPGNIGSEERTRQVVEACGNAGVAIRVGVNGGSLDKRLLEKYGAPTAEALAESAMEHVAILEKYGFTDTVISIKSSNVKTMMNACRLVSERCDYPLHLGVTEAGTEHMGIIKNSIGIGGLLVDGIGSTIRVTLTADPIREIYAAKDI